MPVLLGPAGYEGVRKSIQIDLTVADLPDEVIALDQYAGEAERQILGLATNLAPTLSVVPGTDGWRQLTTAAILLCGALIVGAIPQLSSEQFADYRYTRVPMDPLKVAAMLRARAMALVSAAIEIDLLLGSRPPSMILGPGGRGNTTPRRTSAPSFIGPF